jgi:hypothetical protein
VPLSKDDTGIFYLRVPVWTIGGSVDIQGDMVTAVGDGKGKG